MSKWIVDWETWNFDKNGHIQEITGLTEFTVKATSFKEAIERAKKRASKELCKAKKRVPENFAAAFNSVPHIRGLKAENGAYHEISKARTVFGGQITELPDYGSFE